MSKKRKALDGTLNMVRSYLAKTVTAPIKCSGHHFSEDESTVEFIPLNKQLVCFDWDKTLSKGHSHNEAVDHYIPIQDEAIGVKLFNQADYKPCGQAINFAKKYYSNREAAFNNADSIHYNITKLIERGVNVAIVTYNKFPEIIKYGLEKIGFNPEQISKMHIIYGFPVEEFNKAGKMEHIAKAKELCDVQDNKNVILADDSEENITIAESQGVKCCLVNGNNVSVFMPEVMDMVQYKEQGFVPEPDLCSSPPVVTEMHGLQGGYKQVTNTSENNLLPGAKTNLIFSLENSFNEDEFEDSNQLNKRDIVLPDQEEPESQSQDDSVFEGIFDFDSPPAIPEGVLPVIGARLIDEFE
jgi:hypothetical protein